MPQFCLVNFAEYTVFLFYWIVSRQVDSVCLSALHKLLFECGKVRIKLLQWRPLFGTCGSRFLYTVYLMSLPVLCCLT